MTPEEEATLNEILRIFMEEQTAIIDVLSLVCNALATKEPALARELGSKLTRLQTMQNCEATRSFSSLSTLLLRALSLDPSVAFASVRKSVPAPADLQGLRNHLRLVEGDKKS